MTYTEKILEELKQKIAHQIAPTGLWAVQELWEDVETNVIQAIQQTEKEMIEKIKTLASIIKDIKGYSPDGEVGTLCDQALQITNLDKEE